MTFEREQYANGFMAGQMGLPPRPQEMDSYYNRGVEHGRDRVQDPARCRFFITGIRGDATPALAEDYDIEDVNAVIAAHAAGQMIGDSVDQRAAAEHVERAQQRFAQRLYRDPDRIL